MNLKNQLIIDIIQRGSKLLSKKQKLGALLTLGGIVLNGIFDVIGLATILPVITIAVTPEILESNEYLKWAFEYGGFASADDFLIFLVIFLFLVFLVKGIISLIINYFQIHFTMGIAKNLAERQFIFFFNRGYQFVKNIDTGKFIADVKNIPNFFAQGIVMSIINFFSEIFVITVILVGISLIDFRLILTLALILGGGFILIYISVKQKVYKLGEERKYLMPATINRINETLRGYVDVTIFNRVPFFLNKFKIPLNKEYDNIRVASFYNMIPPKANEIVVIGGIVLVFLYGIIFSNSREELFLLLGMMAVAAYRIMPSMNRILIAMMTMKNNMFVLDILSELTKFDQPNLENIAPKPIRENLVIRNLTFSFEDSDTPVLNDVSFEVRKGETIGFIGESGSGKTTMMKIILRLLKETSGSIEVDGEMLTNANERSWQKTIGYVQQDIFLLDGTLLDNIVFGIEEEKIDEKKVIQTLKKVGLDRFVESLPDGVYTYIGEFGSRLSGGQKQRLAIARSLYQDVSVFVFDEVTSALDPETEMVVTESIAKLAEYGKTIFLIAHRLTTLNSCDRIYELKDGKIERSFEYDELIKTKLGLVRDN